jgi:hypothetical protein
MSVTLWTALVVQFATVCLLRLGLGKGWLRRPVTLLNLVSVTCGGLALVLLSFPSVRQWDPYLTGLQQGYIDDAALIMATGMLAFTAAYLLASPRRGEVPACREDARVAARVLDWRLAALACLPLAVLTWKGQGYNNGTLTVGAGAPAGAALASAFFVLTAVLASAGFLLRHGTRWFLPVLAAQSLLLACAGERTPLIAAAVALIVVTARAGRKPSAAQLLSAAVLTVVALAAVTGVRTVQGRALFHRDSGLRARVGALAGALSAPPAPGPGLAAQAAVRLDGTSFAGAVLQARALGDPQLPVTGAASSLLLAVPSAAWSSKPETGTALNPVLTQMQDFGLQQVNWLPGLAGLYTGFLSGPWLVTFLAALGVLAGRGERWLMRRCTPSRLVLLAGAVTGIFAFQAGLPVMLVTFRPALVIAAGAWLAVRYGKNGRKAELSPDAGAAEGAMPTIHPA